MLKLCVFRNIRICVRLVLLSSANTDNIIDISWVLSLVRVSYQDSFIQAKSTLVF